MYFNANTGRFLKYHATNLIHATWSNQGAGGHLGGTHSGGAGAGGAGSRNGIAAANNSFFSNAQILWFVMGFVAVYTVR